ncbi:transcriptional activator protein SolR-like protein [Agrobacterium tumefaciens LBA4213 (Ach5)]|nr:transcriptional activator protein SolR-like protein [Agrobacterium tumefaciens LBA4213 (Ach5)]
MHDILHFISACYQAGNADRVRSEFVTLIREYGFEYFLVSLRMTGELASTGQILAQHLPEGWIEVYRAKKYNLVDPVRKVIGMVHKPFQWKEALEGLPRAMHRKRANVFFHDAGRYGLQGGYAFPVHGPRDSSARCSLAARTGNCPRCTLSCWMRPRARCSGVCSIFQARSITSTTRRMFPLLNLQGGKWKF